MYRLYVVFELYRYEQELVEKRAMRRAALDEAKRGNPWGEARDENSGPTLSKRLNEVVGRLSGSRLRKVEPAV